MLRVGGGREVVARGALALLAGRGVGVRLGGGRGRRAAVVRRRLDELAGLEC